jgi:hypothetical protein
LIRKPFDNRLRFSKLRLTKSNDSDREGLREVQKRQRATLVVSPQKPALSFGDDRGRGNKTGRVRKQMFESDVIAVCGVQKCSQSGSADITSILRAMDNLVDLLARVGITRCHHTGVSHPTPLVRERPHGAEYPERESFRSDEHVNLHVHGNTRRRTHTSARQCAHARTGQDDAGQIQRVGV